MAGKKLYSLERPDDKAKELASKLTLEEQVCTITGKMTVAVHRLCGIFLVQSNSRVSISMQGFLAC